MACDKGRSINKVCHSDSCAQPRKLTLQQGRDRVKVFVGDRSSNSIPVENTQRPIWTCWRALTFDRRETHVSEGIRCQGSCLRASEPPFYRNSQRYVRREHIQNQQSCIDYGDCMHGNMVAG